MRRRFLLLQLAVALAACDAHEARAPAPEHAAGASAARPRERVRAGAPRDAPTEVTGRPLAEWVAALRSDDDGAHASARDALLSVPDAAVEAVLARMLEESEPEEAVCVDLLAELHAVSVPAILQRVEGADDPQRALLFAILFRLGADSRVEPQLGEIADEAVRHLDVDDAMAFAEQHPREVARLTDRLVEELRSGDEVKAPRAASLLAAAGPAAGRHTDELLAVLRDGDRRETRAAVAEALGYVGEPTAEVIAALVSATTAADADVRRAAAAALGDLGIGESAGAENALRSRLGDREESEEVRCAALRSLVRCRGDDRGVIAEVRRLASSAEEAGALRELAAGELARYALTDPESLSDVVAVLTGYGDPTAMYRCVSESGELRNLVFARLVAIVEDRTATDRAVAWRVVNSLDSEFDQREAARFAGDPCAAIRADAVYWQDAGDGSELVASLADPAEVVRLRAAENIGYSTDPSPQTVLALASALADGESSVAVVAARSLRRLGAAATAALPLLRAAEHRDDSDVSQAAAEAIAGIERLSAHADSAPTVESCLADLDATDDDTRKAACEAIEELGHEAAAAAPRLIQLLRDDSVRLWAAIALGKCGDGVARPMLDAARATDADGAVEIGYGLHWAVDTEMSTVLAAADDPSVSVRAAVAKALGYADDARAIATLAALVADPDPVVSGKAAESVETIRAAAPALVDSLRSAAGAPHCQTAIAAAKSLAKITGDSEPLAVALCRSLSSLSQADVDLLLTLAPKASRGAPYASAALRERLDRVTARAAIAVLRAAPDAAPSAASDLAAFLVRTRNRELLTDPEWTTVRVEAAKLMGSIAAPSSASDLENLTLDPCREVRDAAKAALARLGGR